VAIVPVMLVVVLVCIETGSGLADVCPPAGVLVVCGGVFHIVNSFSCMSVIR